MAIPPRSQFMPNHHRPFDTKRLSLRAVRQPEDRPLFLAIDNSQDGFMNSNFTNASIPSPSDAAKFMKSVAEDSLPSATTWLRPTETSEENPKCTTTACLPGT